MSNASSERTDKRQAAALFVQADRTAFESRLPVPNDSHSGDTWGRSSVATPTAIQAGSPRCDSSLLTTERGGLDLLPSPLATCRQSLMLLA
jgi:hypothetical protein